MLLIFILSSILFGYFFLKINFVWGTYLVAFFVSITLVLSIFSSEGKNNWKEFIKAFFLEYIMYINFFIIGLGIYFILKYFVGLDNIGTIIDVKVILILISIVTFLSIILTLANKTNIVKVSFFGLFFLWFLLYFFIKDIKIFYYAVAHINALAVTTYLLYSSVYKKLNKYLAYVIFIFSLVVFFIILSQYFIKSTIILSFTIQFVIFLILSVVIYIYRIHQKLGEIGKIQKEREHEMKLFGYSELNLSSKDEKYLKKYKKYNHYIEFVIDFFIKSPESVKIIFSLTNTIPIIIASWTFFHQLESINRIQNELFYWFGAIMYFINFLLFKKLNWFVIIQRIFAFFVINFVTYFTIIDFSGRNYLYIAIGGIFWNLFATIIILFINKKHNTFGPIDYLIWSIVNFIGVFINIYFLFKIGLNYYLSVGIALLYLGLYLFLYRMIYKRYFLEN